MRKKSLVKAGTTYGYHCLAAVILKPSVVAGQLRYPAVLFSFCTRLAKSEGTLCENILNCGLHSLGLSR